VMGKGLDMRLRMLTQALSRETGVKFARVIQIATAMVNTYIIFNSLSLHTTA
jgi:hypothetical protein